MNICMIVHNNVTRDGRVLREANTLQRAGHSVTILGLQDADAASPVEYLDSGVRIFRVFWLANAYRSLILSALFRVLPVFAAIAAILFGIGLGLKALFAPGGPVARAAGDAVAAVRNLAQWSWLEMIYGLIVLVLLAALAYTAWRVVKAYLGLLGTGARMRASEEDMVRRYAEALMKEGALADVDFPSVKSRIPGWVPDWLLAVTLEPLEWFGANTTKFTLLRYPLARDDAGGDPAQARHRALPRLPDAARRLEGQAGARHPADLRRARDLRGRGVAHGRHHRLLRAHPQEVSAPRRRLHRGERQRRALLQPRLSRRRQAGRHPQRHPALARRAL